MSFAHYHTKLVTFRLNIYGFIRFNWRIIYTWSLHVWNNLSCKI